TRAANPIAGVRLAFRPVPVQDQFVILGIRKIAMIRVIGNVALKKRNLMILASKRAAETTPDGGVSISPGRAHRQSEYDQPHRRFLCRQRLRKELRSYPQPKNLLQPPRLPEFGKPCNQSWNIT